MRLMIKLKYLFPIAGEDQSRSKYFKRAGKIKHREGNHVFAVINSENAWYLAKFSVSVSIFFTLYKAIC